VQVAVRRAGMRPVARQYGHRPHGATISQLTSGADRASASQRIGGWDPRWARLLPTGRGVVLLGRCRRCRLTVSCLGVSDGH